MADVIEMDADLVAAAGRGGNAEEGGPVETSASFQSVEEGLPRLESTPMRPDPNSRSGALNWPRLADGTPSTRAR